MDNHYIADKQIKTVLTLETKTPSGKEMVSVTYMDDSVEVMPLERLETVSSETQSDASTVQQTLKKKVSAMLYLTMHEYGLKMGEVEGILEATSALVNNGYEKAIEVLMGTEYIFLPLNNVNDILMKNAKPEEENNDGTASVGSGSDSADQG